MSPDDEKPPDPLAKAGVARRKADPDAAAKRAAMKAAAAAAAAAEEAEQPPMVRLAVAFLARLERDELIELDEEAVRSVLIDQLADRLAGLNKKPRPAEALGKWLVGRDEVVDVFGEDDAIFALLEEEAAKMAKTV